jgi:hypothetical protein
MASHKDYTAFMAKANAPLAESVKHRTPDGRTIIDITEQTLRKNQYAKITEAILLLAGSDPASDKHEFLRIFWGKELKGFRERIGSRRYRGYSGERVNFLNYLKGIPPEQPERLIKALWYFWWCNDCQQLLGYSASWRDPIGLVRVSLFLEWCEENKIPFPPREYRRTSERDARLDKLKPLAKGLLTAHPQRFRRKDGRLMISRLAHAIFDEHGSTLAKILGLATTPVLRTVERYLRQLESRNLLD